MQSKQATSQPQNKIPSQNIGTTEKLIQEGKQLQRESITKMNISEMLDYRKRLKTWRNKVKETLNDE